MSDMRKQFENWASAPPREFDVERFDEDHDSWPGSYRSYKVQCAWEAWQAAQEDGLVADLKRQLAEAHKLVVASSRDCNATALERNKLRRQLAEAQATLRTTCAAEAIEDPGCPMLDGG